MADELTYPDFKRLREHRSRTFHYGYDDLGPLQLIELLQEAVQKVPPQYMSQTTVYGPDENGDEWGVKWYELESDESYTARWLVHHARLTEAAESRKRRDDNIRHRWKVITEDLDAATTRKEKVRLAKRLGVVEQEAKKYNVELPE